MEFARIRLVVITAVVVGAGVVAAVAGWVLHHNGAEFLAVVASTGATFVASASLFLSLGRYLTESKDE
jgi:hypothetical protein